MQDARQNFIDAATNIAKKNNQYFPFVYINYAGTNQSPICGYGAENVAYLKKIAQKYDPNRVFQTLLPGGFKLPQGDCEWEEDINIHDRLNTERMNEHKKKAQQNGLLRGESATLRNLVVVAMPLWWHLVHSPIEYLLWNNNVFASI